MILPDAKINLNTGVFGTRGFTFSILGDEPSDGSEAPARSQGENPVFTADYYNNPFESGKIYLLTSFHPDYMDPTVVGRAVFNELGGVTFVSSAEAPGTTAAGSDVSTGYPHAEYQLTDPVSGQVSTWQWSELRQKFILVNSTIPIDPNLRQVLLNGYTAETSILLQGDMTGNPQVFFKQGPTPSFQGLSFLDASHADRGVMGFDTDGGIVFVKDGKYVSKWTATQMEMMLEVLNAGMSRGVFQTLSTTALQSSQNYEGLAVFEFNPVTSEHQIKYDSVTSVLTKAMRLLDRQQFYNEFIAPYANATGAVVAGDSRLVEAVYCFTEIANYNEQYIPITYSMLGVAQNHSLNTAGINIARLLKDADDQPVSYVAVSFPSATQFLLTPRQDAPIDSDWTAELELRKKTPGTVVTGGGVRYVLVFTRLLTELAANTSLGHPSGKKLYLLPAGFQPPAVGSLASPIGSGWAPYAGLFSSLGTDCVDTPPVVAGAPTWNVLTPPAIGPGQFYEFIFSMDAATNPGGVGLTVGVTIPALFPYLNVSYPDADSFRIYGTAPTDLAGASVGFPLIAQQSDGKTTPYTLIIPLSSPTTGNNPPVWNSYTWKALTPGQYYETTVKITDLVTAGKTGLSVSISKTPPSHPWLNFTDVVPGQPGHAQLYGYPPAGLSTAVLYALTALQSDGQVAPKVVSIPIATPVTLYLAVQQLISLGNRTVILRAGGDYGETATNFPWITLTGPAGFVGVGRRRMRRWEALVLGVKHFYDNDPGNVNPPVGTYNIMLENAAGDQVRYGSFVLTTSAFDQLITLSPTPPTTTPVAIAVERIDYEWQASPTQLRIFIKTNGGTVGSLQWSYEIGAPGGLETPDAENPNQSGPVAYMPLTAGDYGSGYTLSGTKTGLPTDVAYSLQLAIFVRVVGTTNPLSVPDPPTPRTSNVTRTNIYPVGSAPTFTILGVYESLA